ncbi:MAG: hypothetical protein OEZ13_10365 [Spirochaetia bacterium]|nr:hypothetical protein [Spirochaetia bacterium]
MRKYLYLAAYTFALYSFLFDTVFAKEIYIKSQIGTVKTELDEKPLLFSWCFLKNESWESGIYRLGKNNSAYGEGSFFFDNFSITAGSLSKSIDEGFIISNGGYSAAFLSLPYKRPAGVQVSIWHEYFFLDAANYVKTLSEDTDEKTIYKNFIRLGIGRKQDKDKITQSFNYRISLLSIDISKKTSVKDTGISGELRMQNKIGNDFFSLNFQLFWHFFYGRYIQLKGDYKNVYFQIMAFQQKKDNIFASELYDHYKKAVSGKIRHGYGSSAILVSRKEIRQKHIAYYRQLGAYFYSKKGQKLLGLFIKPEEKKLSPAFNIYKELSGKGYMISASLGLGKFFRTGLVYADKFQKRTFVLDPVFLPSFVGSEGLREDSGYLFQNTAIGIEGYLNHQNLSFFFAALKSRNYFSNKDENHILFKIASSFEI